MWNEKGSCTNWSSSTCGWNKMMVPMMIVLVGLIAVWIYFYSNNNVKVVNDNLSEKPVIIDKWLETNISDNDQWTNSISETTGTNIIETEITKWLYTDYSSSALKEAKWDIVLFFHANWCTSCVATNKDIISKWVPNNLTILKADFDSETELKKKYEVLGQMTFVQVDNQGNMIKKWIWGGFDGIVEKIGEK